MIPSERFSSRGISIQLFSLLSLVSLFFCFLFTANGQVPSSTPGIRTDRSVYPEPALPVLPPAGGKFSDPVFGTEIMRATDESDGGAPGLGTYYSHWPTFNSDNTKILIRKGVNGEAIIKDFDAVNFQLGATHTLPALPDGTSVAWQGAIWSNTEPNIIYCHSGWYGANYPNSGMKFYRYDVRVGTPAGYTLVKDLSSLAPGQPDFLGQGYMSADDDTFCWLHFRISGGNGIVWGYTVYRRSTNLMLNVPDTFVGGIDEVHIDRTGRYLEIKLNQNQADGSRTRILDLQTNVMQVLMVNARDKPTGHGDNGYGSMVGFDAWEDGIHVRNYNDMHNPVVKFLFTTSDGTLDWTLDFHLSMNATDQNWATVGTYYDPGGTTLPHSGVFSDEIFQVALDGSGRFRRICHTRSKIDNLTATTGYWAVPKANISKDGRFIAYTSNWGKSGRYDLFIAKIDPPSDAAPTPTPTPTPTLTPTPTPTPLPQSTNVSFVQLDTTTKGNWENSYGANGYNTVNDSVSYPSYAQVSATGYTSPTWMASTTDVRGLQKAAISDRIAARWDSNSFLSIDLNLTDGATHQIAIYGLDWDSDNRTQRIDVLDWATNAILDSRTISSFNGGQYLVWNIRGHVKITVNKIGGKSAVVSGLYFGGPVGTPTATPTPTPTPSPTPNLGKSVGKAKRSGQNLSNQLVSTSSTTELSSTNVSLMDLSAQTALEEFVSEIQQAYAVFNDNRGVYPAAARIDVVLQAALAAASQANQAATQGDLPAVKSHLREAITNLELSDVLITYGDVANPIDFASYMVRQQYVDFLNREPDQSGGDFWINEIVSCGTDVQCVEVKRINVSAAFFLSIEFQQTGYYVYRLYKSSYGRVPMRQEFLPDNLSIAGGVIVGADGWEAKLAGNKQAFVQGWVQRADFQARYAGLTNAQYVDTLIANVGMTITPAERDNLVQDLVNGASRADVLGKLVENPTFTRAEFNSAFVLMQYFGYLGRDPDAAGFDFWLNKLNQFDGNFVNAEMVKAFLVSAEYRGRFGL